MNLLLDTHVLLWWLDNPELIAEQAREAIRDPQNVVYVSSVSVWEIVIKKSIGKLDAPDNLNEVIEQCRFLPLPITFEHALAVRQLPMLHHDPVDRLLIAQCKVEKLVLVTRDAEISRYSLPCLKA
jgi:PIN domain nuclease of toxin-antitoxin system